jgi:hypothetical protein
MPSKSTADASFKDLQSELRRRESLTRRRLAGLVRTHDRLTRKLAFVEDQIRRLERELGASARLRPTKRVKNERSLADAIAGVLTKRPMSITAIMAAVNKSGYVSNSPNFRTMVNQTLGKDKRVKRVERGKYAAR